MERKLPKSIENMHKSILADLERRHKQYLPFHKPEVKRIKPKPLLLMPIKTIWDVKKLFRNFNPFFGTKYIAKWCYKLAFLLTKNN